MQTTTINTGRRLTNVGDVKTILSDCHLLVMKAQLSGNFCFDGHRPTEEENRIAEQCRMMSGKIVRCLEVCPNNEIPELLDYYDITYRIGNKRLPDTTFINSHKRRVFMSWKTGDKNIAESTVFRIVASEVSFRREKADREYYVAYRSMKEKWLDTLKKHDRFPGVTTYENYRRLALVMRENLDREIGKAADEAKRRWYELNRVDDLSTLGSYILKNYRRFVSSLFPSVLDSDTQLELDNRILSELSTRIDLPPRDRQAFTLSLQFNNSLQ